MPLEQQRYARQDDHLEQFGHQDGGHLGAYETPLAQGGDVQATEHAKGSFEARGDGEGDQRRGKHAQRQNSRGDEVDPVGRGRRGDVGQREEDQQENWNPYGEQQRFAAANGHAHLGARLGHQRSHDGGSSPSLAVDSKARCWSEARVRSEVIESPASRRKPVTTAIRSGDDAVAQRSRKGPSVVTSQPSNRASATGSAGPEVSMRSEE